MNALQVVGDRDTVLAFRLGGIPGHVVQSASEARVAMETIAEQLHAAGGPARQPTLVLVTQEAAQLMREYLNDVILDPHGPLVLEIPGFAAATGGRPLERFVERVLGVHL